MELFHIALQLVQQRNVLIATLPILIHYLKPYRFWDMTDITTEKDDLQIIQVRL